MTISMSISKGKGNIKHNTRTQSRVPNNIDTERSSMNRYLIHEDIKQVYDELFGGSVSKYNANQKRNDRKIKDYYSKISNSKKEKTFHELVVQLGNRDEQVDVEMNVSILSEFVEQFKSNNPQFRVIGAYIHLDESTPHLHLDYVPFANYEKGLKKRVSNNRAIEQMNYSCWNEWKAAQFETLEKIAKKYDLERENMNNNEKHIASVPAFKALEKQKKELEELEARYRVFMRSNAKDVDEYIEELESVISYMHQENKFLKKWLSKLYKLLDYVYQVVPEFIQNKIGTALNTLDMQLECNDIDLEPQKKQKKKNQDLDL